MEGDPGVTGKPVFPRMALPVLSGLCIMRVGCTTGAPGVDGETSEGGFSYLPGSVRVAVELAKCRADRCAQAIFSSSGFTSVTKRVIDSSS